MPKIDQKVVPDGNRIKSLRSKMGLSIAALEDTITSLYDEGRCSRKLKKSVLHRIETSGGKPIPFGQIQIIASALKVEPDSLTLTDKPELQKVRTLYLSQVTTGNELRSMTQGALLRFHLEEEPGNVEAQDAILKLLELLKTCDKRRNFLETTRYDFELRRIIDTLTTHRLRIYTASSKQVAPFEIKETQEGYYDADFMLINSPVNTTDGFFWERFEGVGLADMRLIYIYKDTDLDLSYEVEHDMDPAGFITENTQEALLIENITRVCDGEEILSVAEFRELASDDFSNDQARKIELRDRKTETRERIVRAKREDDWEAM